MRKSKRKIEKPSGGFPNLDKFLPEKKKMLVTYSEGAEIYQIPYYSFVRLAKEAGANYTLRRTVVVDVEIIEKFLDENPEVAMRVDSVKEF